MKQGLGRQYRIKKDFYMAEYEGFWKEDKKHGHGKYIEQEHQDSIIVYIEGIWENDQIQEITKMVEGSKKQIDLVYQTSFPAKVLKRDNLN